ncbi:MAG: hypothetical protein IH964_12740 [Candidatus Dadabacteria bacterium]|nr:hypothetical protein [Candidatus Dadabacteria bacterium]
MVKLQGVRSITPFPTYPVVSPFLLSNRTRNRTSELSLLSVSEYVTGGFPDALYLTARF